MRIGSLLLFFYRFLMRNSIKINDLENTNILSWQEAYSENISFFQDQTDYLNTNQGFEQLILGRTFYPRPFISSPIQHVISLPWATEYFILPYWFFFFSLGLVSIWLITLYIQTTLHIESRFLRRETRGFSRAQTGDALTSVVPLAWSISMLMHASVHSFNFDDNTAGTVFSFNVLAYQWGWNYYFPSDLIKLFKEGPKRVGHSSIENFATSEPYSLLLARFRTEYLKKITMQGSFVNKNLPILSPLSYYIQVSNSDINFEPVIFSHFANKLTEESNLNFLQNHTSDFLIKAESNNSQYYNVYSWLLSSPSVKILSNYSFNSNSFFLDNFSFLIGYKNFFFSLPQQIIQQSNDSLFEKNTFFDSYIYSNIQFSPFRAPSSLALIGNKYFLIHKHFSNNFFSNFFSKFNWTGILQNKLSGAQNSSSLFNLNNLPVGFFNTQAPKSIINADNIISLNYKPDYTGFGLLNSEDFNFTSSAASTLSISLSANSSLLSYQQKDNFMFNGSSILFLNKIPLLFSSDFINDWSSSFLLSNSIQSWVLSSINLLNSPKLNFLENSLFFFYHNIFNNFSFFFFNFFSTNHLSLTLSWLDLLSLKNYIRGVNYKNYNFNIKNNFSLVSFHDVIFFWWNDSSLNFKLDDLIYFFPKYSVNLLNTPLASTLIVKNKTNYFINNSFLLNNVYFNSVYFFFNKNKSSSCDLNLTFSLIDQINLCPFNNYFDWFFSSTQQLIPLNLNIFNFDSDRLFSTKLLNGLDFSKPAKNFSSFMDPIDFSNGSVSLYFTPLVNFIELFNWSIAWINLATIANSPSYKIWKGGYVRRLFSNELASYYSLFSYKQTNIKNAQLTKINLFSELPKLSLYDNCYSFFEENPAILDKEWAPYNMYTLLDVPAPFEDLDPIFIHKRWTTDINTTRRTDHSSRYLVSSGPVLSSQKNKKIDYFSNFWFSFIGPKGYKTTTVRDAVQLSSGSLFYNHPNFKLANTQFLLNSYLLTTSLYSKDSGFLSTSKGNPMLPFCKQHQNASSLIKNLSLNQNKFLFNFSLSSGLDLNLNQLDSIWSFRSSIFSQEKVRNFGQNITNNSAISQLVLSLLSYNNKLNSFISVNNNSFSQLNNHPLLFIFDQNQSNNLVFNKFFSYLSSNFIELTGLKRDLYTFIPEDIRSIKRLRTSKAVCLPSDIPMHIVCGSKDVIHSWAIPGLGIKIDCIPGFSSHRRLTIRWRGTFWGQCMEVCGRYHHWMPILIHVTHRDLFISWCLSFLKALETRQSVAVQPILLPSQFQAWLMLQEYQNLKK